MHRLKLTRSLQAKATGIFNPFLALLFWPFHIALHFRIDGRRRVTKEPLYNKVVDGWYIGGWPHVPGALPKEEKGISVVDCTVEFERRHQEPYLCVPTWDTQGEQQCFFFSRNIGQVTPENTCSYYLN